MQPGDMLTADMLENYEKQKGIKVGKGEIALINFGWMTRYWRSDSGAQWFATNAPGITEEVAVLLKETRHLRRWRRHGGVRDPADRRQAGGFARP